MRIATLFTANAVTLFVSMYAVSYRGIHVEVRSVDNVNAGRWKAEAQALKTELRTGLLDSTFAAYGQLDHHGAIVRAQDRQEDRQDSSEAIVYHIKSHGDTEQISPFQEGSLYEFYMGGVSAVPDTDCAPMDAEDLLYVVRLHSFTPRQSNTAIAV